MASVSQTPIPSKVKLSKFKFATPRDADPTDTICIWDEKALETQSWKAFGIKGLDNLENMYYALISMLRTHYKKIENKSKFPQKLLNTFLASLNQVDLDVLDEKYKIATDPEQPHKMGQLELLLVLADKYPRIGIFLKEEDDSAFITGIHLFSSELLSLLKWMNQYYGIGNTQFKVYDITKDFKFF